MAKAFLSAVRSNLACVKSILQVCQMPRELQLKQNHNCFGALLLEALDLILKKTSIGVV